MWQLLRKSLLDMIGGGNEKSLLEWANSRLKSSSRIKDFKDPSLKDC